MSGVLSKGIKFSYMKALAMTEIDNLQEVPELGGKVDKVEITTLKDSAKKYIAGIKDFGDLEFKFLYDNSSVTANYRILKGLESAGTITEFEIEFPDATTFTFSASVMTTVDSAKVGDALTFSASLTLNSDIVTSNPTV